MPLLSLSTTDVPALRRVLGPFTARTFGTVAGARGAGGGMRCLSGVEALSARESPARTGGRPAPTAPRPKLLPLPLFTTTPLPGGGGDPPRLPGRLPVRLLGRLPAGVEASVPGHHRTALSAEVSRQQVTSRCSRKSHIHALCNHNEWPPVDANP
jgi:hypothetical protein